MFRTPRRAAVATAVALALAAFTVGAQPLQHAWAVGTSGDVPTLSWSQPIQGIGGTGAEVPIVESSDGSSLYLVGGLTIVTYSAATHQPVASVRLPTVAGQISEEVYQLAASPDGTLFVVAGVALDVTPGKDKTAVFHRDLVHIDPTTGAVLGRVTLPGPPPGVSVRGISTATGAIEVSSDGSKVCVVLHGDYEYTQTDQVFSVNVAKMSVASSWTSSPISEVYGLDTASSAGVWVDRILGTATGVPFDQIELDSLTTGKPIKKLSLLADNTHATHIPYVLGVFPAQNRAVLLGESPTASDWRVSVLRLSDEAVTPVADVNVSLGGTAVSADGDTAYIDGAATSTGGTNDIYAVDLGSGAVTTAVGVPAGEVHYGLIPDESGGFFDVATDHAGTVLNHFTEQEPGSALPLIPTAPLGVVDTAKAGGDRIGDTLSVSPGEWSATPDSESYQWFAGGEPIADATGTTLVLTRAMYGKTVYAVATATSAGSEISVASVPRFPALPLVTTAVPTITGKAALGSTLKADPGNWMAGAAFTYQWNASGRPIGRATASSFTVTSAQEGAEISVTVTGSLNGYAPASATSAETGMVLDAPFAPKVPAALAGTDRYGTAIAISKNSYPVSGSAKTVFIASGENYPDALSAASAAVKLGGPLLLTPQGSLPSAVRAEVKRLAPQRVVVVGGPNAVGPAVLASLSKIAPTVRVAGADRYATSLAVAEFAFGSHNVPSVFFATGTGFADALSAGAYAGANGMPVVLVPGGSASASAATIAWLKTAHTLSVSIAGGTSAVSARMQSALEKAVGQPATRYAGADRFATNVQINGASDGTFAGANAAYVASGVNFPDALAGAAAAGKAALPLYLVSPNCVPRATITAMKTGGIMTVKRLGGPSAIGSGAAKMAACG